MEQFLKLGKAGSVQPGSRKPRAKRSQKPKLVKSFQRIDGIRFTGKRPDFRRKNTPGRMFLQSTGQRIIQLGLQAGRKGKAQHMLKTDQPENSGRVVIEDIRVGGAQFTVLQIGLTVGGVNQQTLRTAVKRQAHGVHGKVAPR